MTFFYELQSHRLTSTLYMHTWSVDEAALAMLKFQPRIRLRKAGNNESQNIPSWKGSTRITESNSWLHTATPKNQTPCLRTYQEHHAMSPQRVTK